MLTTTLGHDALTRVVPLFALLLPNGEKNTMSDKTNFTKDEWALLLRSPMNAGMAVTAAEPGGLWSLMKESFAGSAELAHAAADRFSRVGRYAANRGFSG